jgi:hypothetical protein
MGATWVAGRRVLEEHRIVLRVLGRPWVVAVVVVRVVAVAVVVRVVAVVAAWAQTVVANRLPRGEDS